MDTYKNFLLLKHLYILKDIGFKYIDNLNFDIKKDFSLPNDLNSLEDIALSCNLCPLSKSRNNVLFAYGNSKADLMLILDEPNVIEDKYGVFYKGRVGDILKNMVTKAMNMSLDEVYIAFLVKCKCPDYRDLDLSEILACRPYIFKQIDLVNPKVIISFGENTYRYLLDDNSSKLNNIRGQKMDFKNKILIPTYHPSYLYKNPSFKVDTYKDLILAKSFL